MKSRPILFALLFSLALAPALRAASGSGSLAAVLQPFVDEHTLAGAVTLVGTQDKLIDLEAVGYSSLETKRPMQTGDLFWIASMTKPMTAAALMMLVDEGKVNVDDPVEKYLPEFHDIQVAKGPGLPPGPPQHPLLIREILSHTSGLPYNSPLETPSLDLAPLRDRILSYSRLILEREPGTAYSYSNAGINTAGRIIEVVSGMPYEEFMAKRLFGPLDMTESTFFPNDAQLARLAVSYQPTPDKTGLAKTRIWKMRDPISGPGRYAVPGNGLFSTAADVFKFCRLIAGGGVFEGKRLISEASWKRMTSKETADGISKSYGFGWNLDGNLISHGGAYRTSMSIDRSTGLIRILLVQQSGDWPNGGNKTLEPAVTEAGLRIFQASGIAPAPAP